MTVENISEFKKNDNFFSKAFLFPHFIYSFGQFFATIDLSNLGTAIDVGVRTLCVHTSGLKLLLGTSGGELRELVCDITMKSREKEQIKIKGNFSLLNCYPSFFLHTL